MKFRLGYSCRDRIGDISRRYHRGHTDDPSWADIDSAITRMFSYSSQSICFLGLELVDGPFGTDDLNLTVEHGNCLVLGFHNISETEEETVALDNPNWKQDRIKGVFYSKNGLRRRHPMVDICGNYWDATGVTTNVELVKDVFKEFHRTGTFSHPLLFFV